MDNREREENTEVLETAEETTEEKKEEEEQGEEQEGRQKREKRSRKEKRRNRRGIRMLLLLLQHVALAAAVFAFFVVTVCSTVRISGVHSDGSYVSYTGYSDPGKPFEESEIFETIFGYALADLIRFGVVSSQLETEGAFDGDKVVDVTAYNYRSGGLPEQYVTADYRLEDLLKWNNFGFEYLEEEMTQAEAADFLADTTRVTKMNPKSGYRNTSDAGYMKSDVKTYTSVSDVSTGDEIVVEFAEFDEDSGFVKDYQPIGELSRHAEAGKYVQETEAAADTEEAVLEADVLEPGIYNILVNRYKTAEGKNLEEYVSDWQQYYELCGNVQRAAQSLSYNYGEYVEYQDYYSAANSNIRYLIEKTVGDETQYYSNMGSGSPYRKRVMQLMEEIGEKGAEAKLPAEKFIYYCPADMTYVTNTAVEESTVRQLLQGYDYAYPETVKIWMNVDTAYPAKDAFTRAADYLPNLWQWVAVGFISGVIYLILFIYQILVTGREYAAAGKKRTRLNAFDQIPTEAAVCIAFGVMILAVWSLVVVTEVAGIDPTDWDELRDKVHEDWFKAVLFSGAFAADVLFTFFFYSLVRRIKARTLWKNSWLFRLAQRFKKFAWNVYDNGGIVLRTWVPYGVFLLFNFFVLAFGVWGNGDMPVALFGGIVDVIVGILLYKDVKERQGIVEGIETIAGGKVEHQIDTEELHGDNRALALSVNSIGKGIKEAVEISMKDERMKADLITNVSHDIKTPLTSIINYVDLLKREQVESEKARGYIRVLDEKSQRLKQLTDDLVEASKITSGNISLHFERINLMELMNQTIGEFSEKFDTKNLATVMNVHTKDAVIEADSRRIWRVMENLFNNIFKYAMPGTRVYVTLDQVVKSAEEGTDRVQVTIKNISENPLLCKPEELTERFVRGDESRTTEGSGLGLSIARNLTLAQKGSFEIELDGDLFKVNLTFPVAEKE